MPEWLIERGIGETRYALVKDGRIQQARILVDGVVPAGTQLSGRLTRAGFQLLAEAGGQDYLLPKGAHGVADGAPLKVEITREIIPGWEVWKRPLARLIHGAARVADRISGRDISFPGANNPLSSAGWDDVIEQARTGIVAFEGGELHIFATPAMTLIDVNVPVASEQGAVHAAHAAAKAILRLGIGGSIGIDFPTISGRSARSSVNQAIDHTLPPPFERTSLNGFGFLQIVRPRRHASLIELAQDRPRFEARALLRRAAFESAGPKTLVVHPLVHAVLDKQPTWLEKLARQVGGPIGLRTDPLLPMSGGYAEAG